MDQANLAVLVLRITFGVGLAYHGYNKVFGGGGLAGTAKWFGSIGMKWPQLQARAAAGTEMGGGLALAAGFLTPFAAAGMIGVMSVALWVAHRKNGFFIFNSGGGGWEYTAGVALVAWAVATVGTSRYSLDNAFGISFTGWSGALIAGLLGVGSAVALLAASYRPAAAAPSASVGK